jgi:hypothetical protein
MELTVGIKGNLLSHNRWKFEKELAKLQSRQQKDKSSYLAMCGNQK